MLRALVVSQVSLLIVASPGFSEDPIPEEMLYDAGTDEGKWGYIDKTGKFIIAPRFDEAWSFSKGVAVVRIGDMYGYIDRKGEVVIKPQFAEVSSLGEDLTPVRPSKSGHWGYVDRSGRMVIEPQFSDASGFLDGLALVYRGKRAFYINRKGEVVLEPPFRSWNWATLFWQGWASGLIDDEKRVFIDKTGKIVLAPDVQRCSERFSDEGLLRVKIGDKWGYMDRRGRMAIPAQYDWASEFGGGLACVGVKNKWGTIDKTGKMLIEPKFPTPFSFRDGLAMVWLRQDNIGPAGPGVDPYICIDRNGRTVFEGIYSDAEDFEKDLALVTIRNRYCYIDRTGKIVYEWLRSPRKSPEPRQPDP